MTQMLDHDSRDSAPAAGTPEPTVPAGESSAALCDSRLERILRASNDGYWEWNRDSAAVWVSPRWCEIAGVKAPEGFITVAQAMAAIHPDDLAALYDMARRVAKGPRHGDVCQIEHRYLRPDGAEVWVDARATVTSRDAAGHAVQFSGAVTDITGRKHAEDGLRRFELISENTRDIVLFLRRDDGRILEVNAAAVEAYGYTRDELLSMGVQDLRAAQTLGVMRHEMAKADTETILFETVHRRKDGSTFPAEVSSRGATIGGVRTLISIVRDITERVRAQEAMASAALFPIENPSPVMRVSREGDLVFANAASQPVLDHWGIEFGGQLPAGARASIHAALAQGARGEFEVTCGERVITLIVAPIATPGYVNLYGYDVTDRKRAASTLAQAKARHELLANVVSRLLESEDPRTVVEDLAREVMRILECDVFFNYLVDDATGRLHLNSCAGVAESAERQIEWLDFGSAVCGCVARDQARIIAENILETEDSRTRLVASLGIQAYACHPLMAGGRLIGTLSFGSRGKRRFSDDDLEVMRSVTNHIAIAMERLRARNLLADSEQRYRTIARSIPNGGVWLVDKDLRYRLVEGTLAEVLGARWPRVEGKTVREVVAPELCEVIEERFRSALAGQSASHETEVDGRRIWSHYVPLRDEDGRITRAMALSLDITERKRMEERLLQSQKMESVALLAGGIAHDFNNLLVGIIGNVSLALEMSGPGDAIIPLLEEALKAGEQAAHLTREMLAYSGRGRFVVEPVNISELVRGITNLVRSSIPNQATLNLDLDPGVAAINADATQLQQIVMNLVINAGEAIGSHRGIITVRTRAVDLDEGTVRAEWPDAELAPGAYVCLEVRDTGSGMDAATKAHIFDPFFTTKFTGRGLGLAAVLGIVRGHNGGIRVDSEPGLGTTFTLVFPMTGDGALGAARQDRMEAVSPAAGGTVLVVDDEQIVVGAAKAALARRGYRVLTAHNGQAAIDLLATNGVVDLVVLDLSMPGMSGHEALGRIRALRPNLRVVMSSGYSEAECREHFRDAQITGFLQKPYSAGKLAEAVAQALRG